MLLAGAAAFVGIHLWTGARSERPAQGAAALASPPVPIAAIGAPPPRPALPAIQAQAQRILDEAGGKGSMVALQPGGPPLVSLNATQPMPAASLYKLGVMAAVYQAVQAGTVDLDQQVTITQDEVDFYGDAPATPAGTSLSVQEALRRMITVSDNSAAGALIDLVGADSVDNAYHRNGMPHSHLGSGPNVLPRTIAETTAADQASFFQRLLSGQVVSPAASSQMLALLKDQQENDRLPANLPPGTVVAHKTGELDGVRNDSGIIFTPKGPLLCTVLISDQPEGAREVDAVAREGLLVYRAVLGVSPPAS